MKFGEHVGRAGQLAAVACAGQVVSYVFYIVLAHRTGVSEFEDYAVAVGAVTLLASFTTLGLEKYAVRILPVFFERGDWAGARGYAGFALRRTLWTSIAAGVALALGWGWFDPGSASWGAVAVAMLILPVVSLAQLAVEVLTAAGVQALLLFALVPSLGAIGAAIAYAVAMVGMYAVFVTVAHGELVALRAGQERRAEGDTDTAVTELPAAPDRG